MADDHGKGKGGDSSGGVGWIVAAVLAVVLFFCLFPVRIETRSSGDRVLVLGDGGSTSSLTSRGSCAHGPVNYNTNTVMVPYNC